MSVQKRSWTDKSGKKHTAWRVRWQDAQGWQSCTFNRKEDADRKDAEVTRLKRLGALAQLDAGLETLDTYTAETWVPTWAAPLSDRTRRDYQDLYLRHIGPTLGPVALRDLTPELIGRWQADRLKDGAGPVRVRKALGLLRNILQRAVEAERIQRNAARLVRPAPLPERAKSRPWAPATIEAIRAAMLSPEPTTVAASTTGQRWRAAHSVPARGTAYSRHRDATLISVLGYAGLRPSEALALRWGDVSDTALSVERATCADGSVKGTKTGKSRTVRLLAPLAADLREFRMASGRPPDSAYVFPGTSGTAWSETTWGNWRNREFARAVEAIGLPRARPYDLRHSFASLLLHEGRGVPYVARQLGHGAQLTLGTYGHVLDELEAQPRLEAEAAIAAARSVAHELPMKSVKNN